ncbi:hypothetical protein [Erythrobacter crassostreae]|uniref:Uncharacterized protein n=1 Tax=Erythrobacter crassostreae TaxID=2828328 RepID=A0A9X1F086_9SPHN|nr:hypothetical protein [Erythrobacter crassostrea]MBV7257952.1 hypothetical protein [Erythrobacter crassostrea]
MKQTNRLMPAPTPWWKLTVAIALAGSIAALLAFVSTASAETIPNGSSFDEGEAVGRQVGYVVGSALVPWAAAYLVVLRNSPKAIKWIALAAILALSLCGSLFAQTL